MRARVCLGMAVAVMCLSSCAIPAKVRPAWQGLVRHKPKSENMHALLNGALVSPDPDESAHCLGEFVKLWKRGNLPPQADIANDKNDKAGLIYRVRFDTAPGFYRLDEFDELSAAYDFEIARLPLHRRLGVGVSLVGVRQNRYEQPIERYYSPEIISRPLTAVAFAGPRQADVQLVTIQLLNPAAVKSVLYHGRRVPLAADFSVPWALYLSHTGRLNRILVRDMMSPAPRRPAQLYLMEPYDPKKEPIIMIHGLLSNPLAWAKLTNEIWADDALSSRYQVWHFLYNPSAPALYSAQILRAQWHELRRILDPGGNDPAMRKTTLMAHSMGGLIAKALAVDPGVSLREAVFTVPLEKLNLSPDDRAQLKDIFAWQPERSIHRIIFFNVPHRGTAFADNLIGRIGGDLTHPPQAYQDFFKRIAKANPGAFTPQAAKLAPGKLNGVRSLSPNQPTLRLMGSLPFPPGVAVHSIIGKRGRFRPLAKSSDGFVPYSSSHVDGAASELVVPTGHRSYSHPKAVAEVIRILKL